MSSRPRRSPPARWPFWLLLAAWFCANSPQSAMFAALSWLDEARHFSHQRRLTADVAFVLVGQKIPSHFAMAAEASAQLPLPPVPVEAMLKKLDLAVERTSEALPVAMRTPHRVARAARPPERLGVPPPHEPPRARFAV